MLKRDKNRVVSFVRADLCVALTVSCSNTKMTEIQFKSMWFKNTNNLCRACLNETEGLSSLFDYIEVNNTRMQIVEILNSCANLKVVEGDGKPQNICDNCLGLMNSAFSFRKLCELSEEKLEQFCCDVDDCNGQDTIESDQDPLQETESYTCSICQMEFATLRLYSRHKIKEHCNFQCEECQKMFPTLKNLQIHMDRNHNAKSVVKKARNQPTTCDICRKTFRFHSNLLRHKLTHTGEKPFLCNVCGKGFAQLSYLKTHSFTHTGEKPYKCQFCHTSFAAPGTLMAHVRTHTGERPYVCKICGKNFPQSGYLAAHIRTHTGEKPIECKVCNRRFNQSGRLIAHMRIHSGEKPYQCADCGRSFAVKSTLNKHIRTHTGERPYVCTICGQSFAQNGTLSTHMKTHKLKE